MIEGIGSYGNIPASGKSIPNSKAASSSSVKTPSQAASSAPRSAQAVISAAGLPADKLSASIITFARFFSLPLKPNVLSDIRRQVFSAVKQNFQAASPAASQSTASSANPSGVSPNSGSTLDAMKAREALSLAAAAAESKGVELSPKGLEAYAEAATPDWQNKNDDERRQKRRNRNQNEQEEKTALKTDPVTASGLKKMADEYSGDSLTGILNRLPGKDGKRWIVLPFVFSEDGLEFRLSMRILLDNENSVSRDPRQSFQRMALDISVYSEQSRGGEPERKWLFLMENDLKGLLKLTIFNQSEIPSSEEKQLKKALSETLNIPVERITVKTSGASFPCEEAEQTFPVDKAV